jgi:hypothetical protein
VEKIDKLTDAEWALLTQIAESPSFVATRAKVAGLTRLGLLSLAYGEDGDKEPCVWELSREGRVLFEQQQKEIEKDRYNDASNKANRRALYYSAIVSAIVSVFFSALVNLAFRLFFD